MAKSVFQDEKVCFLTGTTSGIEEHHIIFGRGRKKLSEKYGLKIYLRYDLHRGSKGVHQNEELDLEFKQMAQRYFEEHIGTRDDFKRIFGRNYL